MGRKFKILNLWLRRKAHLPLFIVAIVVILMLFFNEDTSFSRNREYDKEIVELTNKIKLNNDSAKYYKQKYNALLTDKNDLERVAREQYNMQRTTEDVYIIRETK